MRTKRTLGVPSKDHSITLISDVYIKRASAICVICLALLGGNLACGVSRSARQAIVPATRTPMPTFTPTIAPSLTPTFTPSPTLTATAQPSPTLMPQPTVTPQPTPTPLPTETPTQVVSLPTPTPEPPIETLPPTHTPSPEPVIRYVLADARREFNCDFTAIYGTVSNANGRGLPDVTVRALGIKSTGGEYTGVTDGEGRYEIFRIPLPELQAGEWAIMVMENGVEASERFHWASTPVCKSDDTGNSQVLRIDWKLIE